jgi:hypothetical protein
MRGAIRHYSDVVSRYLHVHAHAHALAHVHVRVLVHYFSV